MELVRVKKTGVFIIKDSELAFFRRRRGYCYCGEAVKRSRWVNWSASRFAKEGYVTICSKSGKSIDGCILKRVEQKSAPIK